jgi:hypothetical protein
MKEMALKNNRKANYETELSQRLNDYKTLNLLQKEQLKAACETAFNKLELELNTYAARISIHPNVRHGQKVRERYYQRIRSCAPSSETIQVRGELVVSTYSQPRATPTLSLNNFPSSWVEGDEKEIVYSSFKELTRETSKRLNKAQEEKETFAILDCYFEAAKTRISDLIDELLNEPANKPTTAFKEKLSELEGLIKQVYKQAALVFHEDRHPNWTKSIKHYAAQKYLTLQDFLLEVKDRVIGEDSSMVNPLRFNRQEAIKIMIVRLKEEIAAMRQERRERHRKQEMEIQQLREQMEEKNTRSKEKLKEIKKNLER